jgi:GNAT superfamily N-acetyltransferase
VVAVSLGNFYEKNGMYLRILAFVVKQNVRNLGIGKILIKASEDWAKEQGLHTVIINSGNRDDRKVAHVFYNKMGYTIKSSGFVKQL